MKLLALILLALGTVIFAIYAGQFFSLVSAHPVFGWGVTMFVVNSVLMYFYGRVYNYLKEER